MRLLENLDEYLLICICQLVLIKTVDGLDYYYSAFKDKVKEKEKTSEEKTLGLCEYVHICM